MDTFVTQCGKKGCQYLIIIPYVDSDITKAFFSNKRCPLCTYIFSEKNQPYGSSGVFYQLLDLWQKFPIRQTTFGH